MKQHDFKDGNRLKRLLLFSIPKILKKEEVMLILKLGIPSGLQMKEEVTKPWKKNFQKGVSENDEYHVVFGHPIK